MINFETEEISNFERKQYPFLDFDIDYTFYYDETNNIKKLTIKDGKFNNPIEPNFVLGGVFFEKERPDLQNILMGVRLQANIKEVKFNHIAYGDFFDCLKSKNLNQFLKNVLNTPLYFHYTSVNLFYYSTVDIVDSIIGNSKLNIILDEQFNRNLKNELYKLCILEIDNIVELFQHFNYPNLREKDILPFIKSLQHLFSKYESHPEFFFWVKCLNQLLKESETIEDLPLLMGEDLVLINNLSSLYLRQIYIFRNSSHIFDNESSIEEMIGNRNLTYKGRLLKNFKFEDSKDDVLIQVSDILIGLFGKLTTFINSNSKEEIKKEISSLNETQKETLDYFLDIIVKSDKKNQALLLNIESLDAMSKKGLIFRLRNKE